ncbi:hypothetical protein LMB24_09450 [Limosilactobacillus reuteri]|uniref:Uncharacterized protein n=1 Tax=Limosilactobacillus balticus TaxID=2759747 RepID=A0ABS8RCS0_9LACO|nr:MULTISPECIES: hypothetical protein [Limosilactobacillus]MCC4349297.1 hypothetical protein [Limosilactobacillus reuteri]MCC4359688.1 hypothetical protein [Limosilactobacillus reuteri]MCC4379695.1 hypothetical protein [Limosilactobacillus reuteri]MCC4407323.1 hypothetical protein [Limosilactobacillus reuteri]MCC4416645.1 hypothetical protein [Limosilactobacillus reuteri]
MYTRFQNGKQLNFLASEKFTAFPETINKDNYNVQTDDLGRKYVPAGTVYPTNDAKAVGITVNDVYVSEDGSNQMVAVMREGWVLSQRLTPTPSADAIKAMTAIHFKDLDTTADTTTPADPKA